MVNVSIICPSCSKKGIVEVEEEIVNQSSRGITAANVLEGHVCSHSFIVYVDRHLAIRDCFITDFTIELPEMKTEQIIDIEEIPDQEVIDVDLLKINIPALTLTFIIRAWLFKKPILVVYEGEFLHRHIFNFIKFISKNLFEIEFDIEEPILYKKNKKNFKKYVVLDMQKVLNDKEKILEPKKIKIERIIIQKFLAEYDPKTSLIVIKNEIQKAYELSKNIVDYLQKYDRSEKLTPKLLSSYLAEKYSQNINQVYLKFLIKIVQNYFEVDFSKLFSFDDYFTWNWYLKE
jgi:hypothetical protein